MKKIILLLTMFVLFGFISTSSAEYKSPIGFGIYPDKYQYPSKDYDIYGIRLNYIGTESKNVYGIDFGGVGITRGTMAGIGVNVFNKTGDMYGLQLGAVGITKDKMAGIGVNVFNKAGDLYGLQAGVVNLAEKSSALQVGLFNCSKNAKGLQIGIYNYAKTMKGVQIGIINRIDSNKTMKYMPIINASF